MKLSDEAQEGLATFRRAAKNGQPMLALESLLPVINELVADPVDEGFTLTGDGSAEFNEVAELTPKAKTASSRKTTKAAEETESGESAGE